MERAALLPIEHLARDIPKHSLSVIGASIKSTVLTTAVVFVELGLVRAESAVMIVAGIALTAVHGAVVLSLFRSVMMVATDIRAGIRGDTPRYLTREFLADAEQATGTGRLRPLGRFVMLLAFATPLYPLLKYLFFAHFSVHHEYYFSWSREAARMPWQERLELDEPAPAAEVPEVRIRASKAWSNVAKLRASNALATREDKVHA